MDALNSNVFWLVKHLFVSIFLLCHDILLANKFGVVAWSFSRFLVEQICVDIKGLLIKLALLLFIDFVEFNSVYWWLQRWVETRSCLSRLHHLFSLPFSVFLFVQIQACIETDTPVASSFSSNFIISLSLGVNSILKQLTTHGALLSIAFAK